ncbi:hypothetical protein [Frigoribacterium sp. CFBP9030]|uniref:hypothetical protein n=1 Tax=Frigoribacterium sp. CFBP9030 TaxID=3096537 RepID=UPI002A698E31|nr:hypothetical protein [Frigoribacterium sp. CFBP9030]MDY0892989.1 hypothetical protein [Frigoribacterium sp. CFBP9030]
MTPTVCATLVTVFPVLLLISLVEGRAVNPALRSNVFYILTIGLGTCFGLIGTILTASGLDKGLSDPLGGIAIGLLYAHLLCLLALVVLLFLTYDHEDGNVSLFGSKKHKEAAALKRASGPEASGRKRR